MKIVVIQEEIIQTDITPTELTERWKKLEQLPGIDEVVIEVPAHYLYRRCGRGIRAVDWSRQYE